MEAGFNTSLPCFSDSQNYSLYKVKFQCSFLTINLSSCRPIQSPADVNTITALCQATGIVWDVGFWFALVAGLIGNGLAIFIIASLPKSTSTFYVGLLAVSDLSALCIRGAIDVLSAHSIITHQWPYSNLIAMVFDYCASYSNWLLVLIGLERFLTMRFPLQKRSILTVRRAQLSAVALALTLLLAYGLAASTLDYMDPQVFGVRNMLYAVLPLALNFVIIVLISAQLRRVQRARKKILLSHSGPRFPMVPSTPTSGPTGSSRHTVSTASPSVAPPGTPSSTTTLTSPRRTPSTLQSIAHLENSITVMMLVAAVCFFLLTIPNCVLLYTYEDVVQVLRDAPVDRARWLLLSRVTELLTFLNLSVNFILYFLSAKKFRSQLYRVLTPKSWSVRSGNFGGGGNYNTSSQNNSVCVLRGVPLYRHSDGGSESIPLRTHRVGKAVGLVPGSPGTTAAAAADVAVPTEVNAVVPQDTSKRPLAKPPDLINSFSGQRVEAGGGAGVSVPRQTVLKRWVDRLAGQRTSISSGSVVTESVLIREEERLELVAQSEGHTGQAL